MTMTTVGIFAVSFLLPYMWTVIKKYQLQHATVGITRTGQTINCNVRLYR
jgi:hypothetical protein